MNIFDLVVDNSRDIPHVVHQNEEEFKHVQAINY